MVIDRVEEHSIDRCPECGEAVVRCRGKGRTRSRVIEDIPEETRVEAVEHRIHRAYCPKCKKTVEAKVDAALPGSQVGHRAVALASWFRFGLGIPLNKIAEILNSHLSFQVSNGSVVRWGHRMAEIFDGWYQQIGESVKESGVVNADETGWRVLGKTHWLWCFCSDNSTYYQIDRSRGSPALTKFFTEAIAGTLVTDFWGAYNRVECGGRQKCLPHLFRELDSTSERDLSEVWQEFHKKLRRLLKDGLRLPGRERGLDGETYLLRRYRLDERLSELLESWKETSNRNVLRILKRLRRHREEIFTFLDPENGDVPSDNNRAEREIRPAVIMRKNSNGNQSERGATTQAVLMTLFRTLRRRGYDPLTQIVNALRHYTTAGNLPPLPP